MFKRFFLILILLTIFAAGSAQPADPADYPTLTALEQAVIPVRDRLLLGRELLGITEIAPPPTEPETYSLGERRSFKALNTSVNQIFQFEAELKGIGEHIYIWIDTRSDVTIENAQGLADIFDSKIYPETRDLWGVEASPGIDADTRVFGLFTIGLGSSVAAYYSSSNTYPSEVVADSNEHELFIYDLGAAGEDIDAWMVQSTTAHEFQHMIRDNMNDVQDSWLNEGLSVFTQLYLVYDDGAWSATAYQDNPETQLNAWGEGNTGAHYGGASMWVTYFYERYGLKALQTVSLTNLPSMTAFDHYLQAAGEPGADRLFADWVLANWWRDTDLAEG
ncbi:MAG: hypothetical protein H7X77_10550, partial [Anaerolineae bacterium]|nr:hypothetical protein [Anaerolineae bacterium]